MRSFSFFVCGVSFFRRIWCWSLMFVACASCGVGVGLWVSFFRSSFLPLSEPPLCTKKRPSFCWDKAGSVIFDYAKFVPAFLAGLFWSSLPYPGCWSHPHVTTKFPVLILASLRWLGFLPCLVLCHWFRLRGCFAVFWKGPAPSLAAIPRLISLRNLPPDPGPLIRLHSSPPPLYVALSPARNAVVFLKALCLVTVLVALLGSPFYSLWFQG